LLITDPPELVGYRASDGRRFPGDDDPALIVRASAEIGRVLKPHRFAVSVTGEPDRRLRTGAGAQRGLRPVGHLVWEKSSHRR
jgi:adenine-specific DNA-methyltransferase